MSLITLNYFKGLPLGINTATLNKLTDAALEELIETASAQVEGYCNRKFASTSYTDTVYGTNNRRLILKESPATAITSVSWVDDTGQTGTHNANLFRILPGSILEWKDPVNGPFHSGRLYSVVYTAGYATIPGPVKHAVALWVTELLQPAFAGPSQEAPELVALSSQQIGELLEEYRRKRIY